MKTDEVRRIDGLDTAIRPLRQAFAWVIVLSIASNALVFTAPIYSLQVFDRVLSSRNETTLALLTLIAVGLYAAYAAIEHFRSRALVQVSAALDETLSTPAFDVAFAGAVSVRDVNHTQAVRDVDSIREFIGSGAVVALLDAPWTIVFVVMCFLLHPAIGVFALASGAALFLLSLVNHLSTRSALTEAARAGNASIDRLAAALRNVEIVRALGMTETIRRDWLAGRQLSLVTSIVAGERGGTVAALIKCLRLTVQSGVLGLGALLAIRGEISPGAMIATSILLGRAIAPIEMLVAQWKTVVAVRGAWARFDRALKAMPRTERRMGLPRPKGRVTLENLVVVPPGSRRPAIQGIDLAIEPGETIAIVGRSGSGKSSLARALVGAWPAANGKVRFDGDDIANHDADEVGRHVGYLPQDIELFAGTVRENIARFGDGDDEAVVAAARRAHAHRTILGFEAGYDTRLGEGGRGLSGGQRQQVALARAVYANPAIVVLDEPNSNLDGEGDASLAAAIRGLREIGVTVVVVTHKLDVLGVCDRIVVLDEGRIARVGRPQEILAPPTAAAGQPARPPAHTRIVGARA